MHILIAPNAFKNSLAADRAAAAIAEGLGRSTLDCSTESFPVGDGGDGTARLISQHCNGLSSTLTVKGPLGRPVQAPLYFIDNGKTAIIEMADASGLRLLAGDELNPLRATSFGTGELILAALRKQVHKIVLCVGGSATVDGGAGMLQALGFSFIGQDKHPLSNIPESLVDLEEISDHSLHERARYCQFTILCDVENPLLGPMGAAAVFGPQKGASPADVIKLEASLARLNEVLCRQTGRDPGAAMYGGAAGGVAATLTALLGAAPVQGIGYFLSLTGFDAAVDKAQLVITGEGSIDEQTLKGKAPLGVAAAARRKNKPVIGLAGVIPSPVPGSLKKYFDILLSINPPGDSLADAMKNTAANLASTARALGERIASGKLLNEQ